MLHKVIRQLRGRLRLTRAPTPSLYWGSCTAGDCSSTAIPAFKKASPRCAPAAVAPAPTARQLRSVEMTNRDPQNTEFSRDILGRYTCNGLDEALASTDTASRADARPFDVIIIGGGSFSGVMAQHLFAT